ncbi:hypothetical protein V6N12_059684 [Hibiscus sabdariffa]|uniref:Uncharacterized protein n=1 Tax=Hibiscus sabdariffa TaxID=183260 RepID=A0ABR2EXI5_9ROSI
MASRATVPFWRAVGMTYITYSNICANLVGNCLKEPYKTEVLSPFLHLQQQHHRFREERKKGTKSLVVFASSPSSLPLSLSLKRLLRSFIYFSIVKDGRW